MLEKLVLGAFFATLNGIGLYHPIPLTGINPSNNIWWRGLSSLEIVYSIHGLRKVHHHVFPKDDATSDRDLYLQYSVRLDEYENARLALERTIDPGPDCSNLPGVTSTCLLPSPTAQPTYIYLDEYSPRARERYEQIKSYQESSSNPFFSLLLVLLPSMILVFQLLQYWETRETREFLQATQYPLRRNLLDIMTMFQELRGQNVEFRPMLAWLDETIRYCTSDMQRCLVHIVSMMEERWTSSMILVESKLEDVEDKLTSSMDLIQVNLDEVRKTLEELNRSVVGSTKEIYQIPRQLSWLNILIAKTTSDGFKDDPNGENPVLTHALRGLAPQRPYPGPRAPDTDKKNSGSEDNPTGEGPAPPTNGIDKKNINNPKRWSI
ncbi:hypothetical protein N7535_001129 [Penicillium sp. DV-2018c]|nr:hypothetical protein N7535_001129 [Penicillium sp. DV-2018c]